MGEWWIPLLGTLAGLCTTGSFVPQLVKSWRSGDTGALSTRMYGALVVAFALWMAYGAVIGSWPLVAFNVANLVLSGAVFALKIRGQAGSKPV